MVGAQFCRCSFFGLGFRFVGPMGLVWDSVMRSLISGYVWVFSHASICSL